MKKVSKTAASDPYFYEREAALYKAFAHPTRIHLVELLARGEMGATELQERLKVSTANLSQHLSILRTAGVVNARREGNRLFCELSSREVIDVHNQMRKVLKLQRASLFPEGGKRVSAD